MLSRVLYAVRLEMLLAYAMPADQLCVFRLRLDGASGMARPAPYALPFGVASSPPSAALPRLVWASISRKPSLVAHLG